MMLLELTSLHALREARIKRANKYSKEIKKSFDEIEKRINEMLEDNPTEKE